MCGPVKAAGTDGPILRKERPMSTTSHRILWLIAARSGSKSIPDKNIRELGGIPLLVYRIRLASRIASGENIWISTDSARYAAIAEKFGARAPFIRPPQLATDDAKSADVVLHTMEWARQNGFSFDGVGLLEPTSPFVRPDTLDDAVRELFSRDEADAVVAVRYVTPSTFYVQAESRYLSRVAENIARTGSIRRQEEPREITPSGGFYIARWDAFMKHRTFYTPKTLAHPVSPIEGLEIDEPLDWLWAEFLLERYPELRIDSR